MQGAEKRAAEHTVLRYVSSAATKATQQMDIFQRELNSQLLNSIISAGRYIMLITALMNIILAMKSPTVT